MNKTLMISFLLLVCSSTSLFAQDEEDDKDNDKRPSWSSGLPERQSTTDLKSQSFKPDMDKEIELDMSEFGVETNTDVQIELPLGSELPVGESITEEDSGTDEAARLEQQRLEQERLEQERLEQERLEQERLEQERLEQERLEQERLEQERLEQERLEQERLEQERLEQERLEQERLEQERLEQANQVEDVVDSEPVQEPIDAAAASTDLAEVEYTWNIIKQTPVEYPVKAAIDNLEGWVEVEVTINVSGEVISATPLNYSRRGRIFGKPAVQSVNDWLFEPPSNFGLTEPQTRIYKIEFEL
jgi:TonB family protein